MKGLALLLGKPKGGMSMKSDKPMGPESEPSEEESDGSDDEKAYAKLVVDAIKDGDTDGAADALHSLVTLCVKMHK